MRWWLNSPTSAFFYGVFAASTLAACASPGGSTTEAPIAPWPITPFPPVPTPNGTGELDPIVVNLGRLLFYDPVLSSDQQTACATCHSDEWGMSDSLPRSVGNGAGLLAGPGRMGANVLRRNAPALWNTALRQTQFWDGRVTTLEEQALTPLLAKGELNRDPLDVVQDLRGIENYSVLFNAAFADRPSITVNNLAIALADFQRTLISKDALYEGYIRGDKLAMTDSMVDGMFLLEEKGCTNCHTPPLFEAEMFFDRGIPTVAGVIDAGRFEVTGVETDRGAFRVPTLRNLAFTEPFFHNGTEFSLKEAIRHELERDAVPYSEDELQKLTAFIDEGLRDISRRPTRPDILPSGLTPIIDGNNIPRGVLSNPRD